MAQLHDAHDAHDALLDVLLAYLDFLALEVHASSKQGMYDDLLQFPVQSTQLVRHFGNPDLALFQDGRHAAFLACCDLQFLLLVLLLSKIPMISNQSFLLVSLHVVHPFFLFPTNP